MLLFVTHLYVNPLLCHFSSPCFDALRSFGESPVLYIFYVKSTRESLLLLCSCVTCDKWLVNDKVLLLWKYVGKVLSLECNPCIRQR
jgi:hypothetical protein